MNKEGIEIMSDINLHVGVLEMELESCNEMLGESMKDTENWKNQWLELKENYDSLKNVSVNLNDDKYEKFKKKITKYIYENIMEKLELPNDIEFCSRKEISNMLDNVTKNWEEQLDDFIDQFEEEWDDV